jgi:PIN domain nuclease of toxin-antitoxin system
VLLDTHVFLWMQVQPERFSSDALELLEDGRNELVLSAASSWEISIKSALGRLDLPEAPSIYVPKRMRSSGVSPLAIEHSHALGVAELPPHHRDPFDRMLVAQAQIENVPLMSADWAFVDYGIDLIAV